MNYAYVLNSPDFPGIECCCVDMWQQVERPRLEVRAFVDETCQPCAQAGIGVIWLDLTVGIFDELSHPSSTLKAHPGETEALMEWLDIRRIPAARSRARIEWSGIRSNG